MADVWDGPRWRREFFLRDHDHLISPWKYSPREIVARNAILLKAQVVRIKVSRETLGAP